MDSAEPEENMETAWGPEAQPDVMNDPAFDRNVKSKQGNSEEADTCRICRGEGSKEEPLFYPCKCSGSIKFVHQNCLMEWLSHSQKKHCELCKTPFRFTKLYHPHMPTTVPLPIFLRQAAVHTWKSFLTWTRFHLVTFVWVAWLPWCMRTMWRAVFWIGDGGWVDWAERGLHNESAKMSLGQAEDTMNVAIATNATSSMSREAFASAFVSLMSNNLSRLLSPVEYLVYSLWHYEPFGLGVSRDIFRLAMGLNSSTTPLGTVPINITVQSQSMPRSSSWLSDIQFLNTLTRSTMINNLVIDTLEGQLITLFVVIAFILVFLIREWVVQQQPNLNGGAELNAGAVAPPDENVVRPEEDAAQRRQAQEDERNAEAAHPRAAILRQRRIARPRQRRPIAHDQALEPGADQGAEVAEGSGFEEVDSGATGHSSYSSVQNDTVMDAPSQVAVDGPQRPTMPDRTTIAIAAEIRRSIEEQSREAGDQTSSLSVFTELWGQSKERPLEAIRIIEEQGRTDDLKWIIVAMRKIEDIRRLDTDQAATRPLGNSSDRAALGRNRASDRASCSQPEDDEEFVFLDKPSLTSSPETESGYSDNVENISNTEQERINPEPEKMASSGDQAEIPGQSTLKPHNEEEVRFAIPDSAYDLGISNDARDLDPLSNDVTIADRDSSESPGDASHHNPFHPDYAGELPNRSATYQMAMPLGSDLDFVDTDQAQSSQAESGEVQSHEMSAHGNPEYRTIIDIITDWLWGGMALPQAQIEQPVLDDERIVQDIAAEEPFVRVDRGRLVRAPVNEGPPADEGAVAGQDPEVVAAAIQAGLDPNDAEAAEDIEDLEGILELIGMQGPLAGLVQNAMFCAVLVTLTIMLGVWVPYISGKVFLVILTHPISLLLKLPLRWAASTADMVIDIFTFFAGSALHWIDTAVSLLCTPIGWLIPRLESVSQNKILANRAKVYAARALGRLAKTFIATGNILAESDIPTFSLIAHESLHLLETEVSRYLQLLCNCCVSFFNFVSNSTGVADSLALGLLFVTERAQDLVKVIFRHTQSLALSAPSLLKFNPLHVNLSIPQRTTPLDYSLAYWDTKDRVLAIVFGYMFFALLGVLYLKGITWIRGTNKTGRVDGGIADGLYQAGGVMKVVLIISIEMILFPLYCGLLLDVALLPLFGNVTLMSRINFTLSSPYTSMFIHWFVGTCYMFHFALFVAMCRKILRPGVLYFIRDPDDPTFHPVRDVLERSVSTQLWKISFSALVYGGLVIVCLGGVVWSIAYTFDGVLPIHWSSNEPVLEFPVDLLFYNFLMPLAVKFFKPSKGLNKMYTWWFRKCARALRLTDFLFGDRKEDEKVSHLRRNWTDFLESLRSDTPKPSDDVHGQEAAQEDDTVVDFVQDGRYVRAPASDQVRIPKGAHAFLEVDEDNRRLDDRQDPDEGLHGRRNEMFTQVYIPPFFRIRISAFIFLIWLFAATTGVSATIIPLTFGRFMFAHLAPPHLHMNDIYAFSIGLYILGGAIYGILNRHRLIDYLRKTLTPHATTVTSLLRRTASLALHTLSLIYTYAAFGILLPGLLSLLMEFYFIIPLHTYFSTTFTALGSVAQDRHIIHLIQDWTLGVLYLKMAARLILYHAPSRPAAALRGIVRDGWLNPDVRLATRGFILPAIFVMGVALTVPLGLGWLANSTILYSYSANNEIFRACVYRYSYPGVLALGFAAGFGVLLGKAFTGWRRRVRDEVYLIGERLHNFGEHKRRGSKAKGKGKARAVPVAAGQA